MDSGMEPKHDEVLARLLEENRQRAGQSVTTRIEAASDATATTERTTVGRSATKATVPTAKARRKKGDGETPPTLPGM